MKNPSQAHPRASFLHSAFFLLPSSLLVLLIRTYRVTLSPAKTFLFGPAAQCRFEPSCSCYAIEAVKTHGALAGGWLAAKRICRCHPWGQSGDDPVPPKQPKPSHLDFHSAHAAIRVSRS